MPAEPGTKLIEWKIRSKQQRKRHPRAQRWGRQTTGLRAWRRSRQDPKLRQALVEYPAIFLDQCSNMAHYLRLSPISVKPQRHAAVPHLR